MRYPVLRRRRNRRIYGALTLLVLAIGAISTALLVPPAWRAYRAQTPTLPYQDPINSASSGVSVTPSPITRMSAPAVCGVWRSETSQKQYAFVCHGQNRIHVSEINDHGSSNSGSGKINADGKIEVDILVLTKNRTDHLSLTISVDGQEMEGTGSRNHS